MVFKEFLKGSRTHSLKRILGCQVHTTKTFWTPQSRTECHCSVQQLGHHHLLPWPRSTHQGRPAARWHSEGPTPQWVRGTQTPVRKVENILPATHSHRLHHSKILTKSCNSWYQNALLKGTVFPFKVACTTNVGQRKKELARNRKAEIAELFSLGTWDFENTFKILFLTLEKLGTEKSELGRKKGELLLWRQKNPSWLKWQRDCIFEGAQMYNIKF